MKSSVFSMSLVWLPMVASLLLPTAPTVQRAVTLRRAVATMQEQPASGSDADADAPAVEQGQKYSTKQLEMVAGASDPFRYVRQILYAIFSVVGASYTRTMRLCIVHH